MQISAAVAVHISLLCGLIGWAISLLAYDKKEAEARAEEEKKREEENKVMQARLREIDATYLRILAKREIRRQDELSYRLVVSTTEDQSTREYRA